MNKCIDVSVWNGKIDFKKVKADGYNYIIIKCGGSDDGYYTDSTFNYNYLNAKKNGLKIGAYYFAGSNFISKTEGKKCAEHCLKIIGEYSFDLPIYIDVEVTKPKDYKGTTEAILKFCDIIEKKKFKTGVYSSRSMFDSLFSYDSVKNKSIWVAEWGVSKRSNFPDKCDIWQYSSTGYVNGVIGLVDLDKCYITVTKKLDVTKKPDKTQIKNVLTTYNIKYKKIAEDVINGKYGNGDTRKKKLLSKGYDYNLVQALVNAMLTQKS